MSCLKDIFVPLTRYCGDFRLWHRVSRPRPEVRPGYGAIAEASTVRQEALYMGNRQVRGNIRRTSVAGEHRTPVLRMRLESIYRRFPDYEGQDPLLRL